MLGDLLGISLANLPLTHLLTDTRVELAHLTALSYSVASFSKILRRFDGTFASAGPDTERFRGSRLRSPILNEVLAFSLAVLDERLGHLSGIVFAFLAQAGIGLVTVFFAGGTSATEEGLTTLNVQVE